MTHLQLDVMLAESQVAADEANELRDLLAPLTDVATEAPEPSAELEALFHEGAAAPVGRARVLPLGGRRRGRGAVAGAVVLALSGVGATGLSAAANTLPSPLQHQVSRFSEDFLPFKLPEPAQRHSRHRPDAAQAPKSGSVSHRHVEPREASDAAATRSLGQPRRAVEGAAARIEHDPGHRDGAADGPGAGGSTYSRPRAAEPVEEPGPRASHSDLHASTSSETRPNNEPRRGWTKDEERSSTEPPDHPPESRASHPSGKPRDEQGKHHGTHDDRHDNRGRHDDRGKTEHKGGPGDKPDDPRGPGGGNQDAGPQGDPRDNEPGSGPADVGSRVAGVADDLPEGHAGG